MSTNVTKIGLAILCVDHRLHRPEVWTTIWNRLTDRLKVDSLDKQTLPGPDGALTGADLADDRAAVVRWSRVLIEAHDLRAVAIIAHEQCAGHPASDETHCVDVRKAASEFRRTFPGFSGEVVPFVLRHHTDTHWELEELPA